MQRFFQSSPDRSLAPKLKPFSTGLACLIAATSSALAAGDPIEGPAGSTTQEAAPPAGRLAAPGTNLDRVMAVDGRPAERGRMPEGTSQEAADLWDRLISSLPTAPGGSAQAKEPRSFELVFDGRIRSESTGSNDYTAEFAYLEVGPGLVRATMLDKKLKPKNVQMRGLGAGDALEYWFRQLKGSTATDWIELDRRDGREDRAEVDRWASISYDIARLTDPRSFRVVELNLRKIKEGSKRIKEGILDFENDPGLKLPDTDVTGKVGGRERTVRDLASSLVWLELATPDFKDLGEKKRRAEGPAVRRLVFGMDPKTNRPLLVIVSPHRTDMPLQVPGTLLVQCTDWIESGPEGKAKAWIPGRFLSYETDRATAEAEAATGLRLRFTNVPSADLYLFDTSDMNAQLRREDFLPPKE